MLKEESVEGYRVVHIIPDMSEEEKETVRQKITKSIYKLFSRKKVKE
jgi:hypothetical protein